MWGDGNLNREALLEEVTAEQPEGGKLMNE